MARSRTSKRKSVREESRAVYRRAIVDAAMRVFGRTGFGEAKMADIAAEAGVATGTLYNYFSSKEEIFQSIHEDGRELAMTELQLKLQIEDPLTRVREIVRTLFDILEEHGAMFAIYVQLYTNPAMLLSDEYQDEQAFRRHFLQMVTSALAEAGDHIRSDTQPETLAWALGGLMNGAIINWVEGGCKPGLRENTDLIMDLFLNGATPR